jgi:hypothetical protein
MKLLENEEKLISSNEDKIVLTDHRVLMEDRSLGQSYSISIFLEDISSIEVKYKSNILFIGMGILSIISGIYLSGGRTESNFIVAGFLGGAFFFALWWLFRKHVISISSNGGGRMNFEIKGMSKEKVSEFAHKVSLAKQLRLSRLYRIETIS